MTVALAVLTGFGGCASHERLEPIQQPPSFTREAVAKGAELAHLGNCMGCHTAEGGKSALRAEGARREPPLRRS